MDNNIVAAPVIADVNTLFDVWKSDNFGTLDDFYAFMTSPSVERDAFLAQRRHEVDFCDTVMTVTYIS